MKKLLAIMFVGLGIASAQYADNMPYVSGQVLVMIDDNSSIDKVLHATEYVDGRFTDVEKEKLVSKPTNIWLLSFDDSQISHTRLLAALKDNPHVKIAQNNHYVEDRATTPNDPSFGSQWHHVDPQDNDIDSDLAWDITTGGTTPLGDEIVVCVIEGGGADWDHPDLLANHWSNTAEIPNNGIDDDNNGYIDDVNGWNDPSQNDVINAGSHGTQVSGMIGAVGNNNNNVAGINWDVKIMQVQMGSIGSGSNPNEANVIAAYTYPLVQRQIFNNSGGSQGAFVVATNASWGIDQGDPANAPLWCAFYDTLGVHGILNCGATTNSNLDVDAVGDLPTACGSDYMVSVTRTDDSDGQAGGYGATTIDLGAPGINVVTTSNGGGNGATTGTSFSSPLTAGVIALLYSAPCTSLAVLAKSNPQQAADQVRSALLNGVDPVSSLNGITVTGGRLNAYNSVMEIVNNCSASSCVDPWQVADANTTDMQSDISWGGIGMYYNIRWREVGAATWNTDTTSNTMYTVTGLSACTSYEVEVQAVCSSPTDTSNYTATYVFITDGCCEPPASTSVTNVVTSGSDVSWAAVLAATSYDIRYKEVTSGTWTDVLGVSSPYTITGLNGCTDYEVQVRTVCSGGNTTTYTTSEYFTTAGCGACIDMTYCTSTGASTADEWIETVEVGTINNTSGDNGGYADFTGMSTDMEINGSYPFTLTQGYAGWQYSEYFKIYIDWNQDGDFDDANETAFDAGGTTTSAETGTIVVPAGATLGLTRMRVSMKYNGASTACEDPFDYGEVEDYCVNIIPEDTTGNSISENGSINFEMYPNPTSGVVTIVLHGNDVQQVAVFNPIGQIVYNKSIQGSTTLDLSGLAPNVYTIRIESGNGEYGVKRIVIK